ncbi:alpha/beta hydrolase [Thiomicrorhabdus sp. Milos-T2]|uniref:alpha/beta hydrolase n=1 Tax=Thiomicrorhabdus sp. Milos-T2 TaxID=90814 RepID=UPI000493DDE1|nr:alpha/beta fold hydrolase [Thiomicrorhabdus sp. Milos-T2]
MNKRNKTTLINGPAGNLEVRVKPQVDAVEEGDLGKLGEVAKAEVVKVVVISHPHPLYGGTMDNKVVTTLERAFAKRGYVTIAYNFRGVGLSEGEYDSGVGEQQDLAAVFNWAKDTFNSEYLVLAGFSFGSYVSLKSYMSWKELFSCQPQAICTVAPPVGLYDFSKIDDIDVPWMLIQGGQDEVVSAKEILDWSMGLKNKPDVYWREAASHFFHGELVWLRNVVDLGF